METTFSKSFLRDVKKLKDRKLKRRIEAAIDGVEGAEKFEDIKNARKLTGSQSTYRIRIGDYRLTLDLRGDRVDFLRCLPRKDVYDKHSE